MSPLEFSLRELVWMAEARQAERWNHTSALLAMAYNSAPRKGGAKTADHFHPFAKRRTAPRRRLTNEETERWLDRAFS